MLQQRGLLLELLLADGAAHIKRHGARTTQHVGQLTALEVLQTEPAREHAVVQPLGVLEVGRVLRYVARREACTALLAVLVAVLREDLLLVLVRRVGHVLRPQRRRRPVLEDQVRRHVCNENARS